MKIKVLDILENLNTGKIESELKVEVASSKILEIKNLPVELFSYYKSKTKEVDKTPLERTSRFQKSLKVNNTKGLISSDKTQKIRYLTSKYPKVFEAPIDTKKIITNYIKNLLTHNK